MLIVHFIRHAETTANATNSIAGWTDVPLSVRGLRQAEVLRSTLGGRRFDHVWSSDLSRAIQTAEIAGYSPVPDARVRELNFGVLEGMAWADAIQQFGHLRADLEGFQAPGGESLLDLRQRVFEFVSGLGRGEHAIFCHGGVMRTVLAEMGEARVPANCTRLEVDWLGRSILAEEAIGPLEF